MARNNTVKVSDEELETIKRLRDEIFGTKDTPLGEVITELSGEIRHPSMDIDNSQYENTIDYQQQVINSNRKTILVAGRQVGKTWTLIKKAGKLARGGSSVLFVGPTQRMVMEASNTAQDILDYERATKPQIEVGAGYIDFRSGYKLSNNYEKYLAQSHYDSVMVDEAMYIDNTTIYKLDNELDDITYAGSPSPSPHFVQMWAQYSPNHKTFHVPSIAAPHIADDWHDDVKESMSEESYKYKVNAKYWEGDKPTLKPYESY